MYDPVGAAIDRAGRTARRNRIDPETNDFRAESNDCGAAANYSRAARTVEQEFTQQLEAAIIGRVQEAEAEEPPAIQRAQAGRTGGHEGHHLIIEQEPNEIISRMPSACVGCPSYEKYCGTACVE